MKSANHASPLTLTEHVWTWGTLWTFPDVHSQRHPYSLARSPASMERKTCHTIWKVRMRSLCLSRMTARHVMVPLALPWQPRSTMQGCDVFTWHMEAVISLTWRHGSHTHHTSHDPPFSPILWAEPLMQHNFKWFDWLCDSPATCPFLVKTSETGVCYCCCLCSLHPQAVNCPFNPCHSLEGHNKWRLHHPDAAWGSLLSERCSEWEDYTGPCHKTPGVSRDGLHVTVASWA